MEQWAGGYKDDIKKMLEAPKTPRDTDKVVDNTKPSYVCLPMRIKGRWLMITCDIARHISGWVVFEEWNWKKVNCFIKAAAALI